MHVYPGPRNSYAFVFFLLDRARTHFVFFLFLDEGGHNNCLIDDGLILM